MLALRGVFLADAPPGLAVGPCDCWQREPQHSRDAGVRKRLQGTTMSDITMPIRSFTRRTAMLTCLLSCCCIHTGSEFHRSRQFAEAAAGCRGCVPPLGPPPENVAQFA